MFRMIKNCYKASKQHKSAPVLKPLVFLLALVTYYRRVRSLWLEANLEASLANNKPGCSFYFSISKDPVSGAHKVAYVEPGDLWLGIPVDSSRSEAAQLLGHLPHLVAPVDRATWVHTYIVSAKTSL